MATTTARPAAFDPQREAQKAELTVDDRRALLRYMLLMRGAEERAITLYRQGKVPGSFYDGRGQEAISVGSAFALAPRDRCCVLHRDLGAHFVRGLRVGPVPLQLHGPHRLARPGARTATCTSATVGSAASGWSRCCRHGARGLRPGGWRSRCGSEPRVAMTWFGEGSTANGVWHEAMNIAGVRKLPVVFVLENNQLAYSHQRPRVRGRPSSARGATASRACAWTATTSRPSSRRRRGVRARARRRRPTLIEAVTMRMHGHGAHDDMRYVPKEMLDEWSDATRSSLPRRGCAARARSTWPRSSGRSKKIARAETEWASRSQCPTRHRDRRRVRHRDRARRRQSPWSRWAGERRMT